MKKKLGDILCEAGVIDQNQLRTALSHQKRWGGRLGEILVILNFLSEDRLLKALSIALNLPAVELSRAKASPEAIKLISADVAKKFHVLPISVKMESGKKAVLLAMSDPTNLTAIDEIQFLTGMTVKPVVATDSSLSDAIRHYYDGIPISSPSPKRSFSPGSKERLDSDMIVFDGTTNAPEINLDSDQALKALIGLLVSKGVLTEKELAEKMNSLQRHGNKEKIR